MDSKESIAGRAPHFDVVVVGAGIAGLYLLYRLRQLGLSAVALEAGADIGGTWYWNRYPGARCDIESVDYSYSFSEQLQQEWSWSERYPAQPEVLRYLHFVADRFDLRRDIRLQARVTAAHFQPDAGRWRIVTETGDELDARFCVMATGCLSAPKDPQLPGLDSFRGELYRSSSWPDHPVSFAGKRVGVIGTGSTGIQIIPVVAQEAAHLTVFQRTPSFSVPARNHRLTADYLREVKAGYPRRRALARRSPAGALFPVNDASALDVDAAARRAEYEARWATGGPGFLRSFNDLLADQAANDTAAEFIRSKIDEIVTDPAVAAKLKPAGYPVGARRVCVDTDYYQTFNRDNVTLVDLRDDPLVGIEPTGVRTATGSHPLAALILATGFDAMTGALARIDIRGPAGQPLTAKWADGPRTYLGLAVAGFPNLFLVTGPGSPSVLSNMVVSIEQHVEWITDLLAYLRRHGLRQVVATEAAEQEWVSHVNQVADRTLYPKANSWYTGANVPGKPRVFMPYVGGVGAYREICAEIAAAGYRGFAFPADAAGQSAAPSPRHG